MLAPAHWNEPRRNSQWAGAGWLTQHKNDDDAPAAEPEEADRDASARLAHDVRELALDRLPDRVGRDAAARVLLAEVRELRLDGVPQQV